MAWLVQLLGLAAAPLAVSAHSNMVWPYTWFDKGGNVGNNHNHSISHIGRYLVPIQLRSIEKWHYTKLNSSPSQTGTRYISRLILVLNL